MNRRSGGTTRRRGVVAVLMVAVAVFASLVAAPVSAQTRAGFRNGEAEASADTFSVALRRGNANIAIGFGSSFAGYRDITGTAEAKGLDMGVIQLLLGTNEQCDGSPPVLNPDSFTPPSRTDSTFADAPKSRRVEAFMPGVGDDGPGDSVGFQDAMATKKPSATGLTETPAADIFVLALDNARTETFAQLDNGTREARAVMTADELRVFGGLFTFTKPRWEAVATSGASATERGSFTFERATVLGIPRSPADAMRDLKGFKDGLEELLRPLGVKLELPTVQQDEGRVRVTPMAFKIENMPLGAEVIAPILGAAQPYREALEQQLLAEDCTVESTLTILDLILGVLAGAGSVEILAGGVSAFTADTDFSSPPLEALPTDSMTPAPDPAPQVAVQGVSMEPLDDFEPLPMDDLGSLGTSDLFEDGFDDLSGLDQPMPEAAPTTAAPQSESEEFAAAPAANTRLVGGAGAAAVVVGIVGLVAALGLIGGERLLARGSRRRIP